MNNNHTDLETLGPKLQGQLCAKHIFISSNKKTGLSVNSRINPCRVKQDGKIIELPGTCSPTKWCLTHCYARHGWFAVGHSEGKLGQQQTRYLVNNLLFQHYENASQALVDLEATHLVGEGISRGYRGIRWNGGGDLSLGAVRIINAMTRQHPKFTIWGFTKRADLALQLEYRPNLHMVLSVDPETPGLEDGKQGFGLDTLVMAARYLGGRMAYATEVVDDPKIVKLRKYLEGSEARLDVVFGYHRAALHTVVGDIQECPATSSEADCRVCGWCAMTDEARADEKVLRPKQAFLRHKAATR